MSDGSRYAPVRLEGRAIRLPADPEDHARPKWWARGRVSGILCDDTRGTAIGISWQSAKVVGGDKFGVYGADVPNAAAHRDVCREHRRHLCPWAARPVGLPQVEPPAGYARLRACRRIASVGRQGNIKFTVEVTPRSDRVVRERTIVVDWEQKFARSKRSQAFVGCATVF